MYELQPLTSPQLSTPQSDDWMGRRSPAPLDEPPQPPRVHRHPLASWRLSHGARWWSQLKRADWNLICASILAVFWFLMYCTSPAGKYMRHNAPCPVAMPIVSFSSAEVDSVVHAAVEAEHAAWNSGKHHEHSKHVKMAALNVPEAAAVPVCPVCTCPVCPAAPVVSTVDPPAAAATPAATPSTPVAPIPDIDHLTPSAWASGQAEPVVLRATQVAWQASSHVGSGIRKRVHVRSGLVPNLLQFAESTFEPGDEVERHMHATATEIFYVRSGVLSIYFDDELGATAGAATTAASNAPAAPLAEAGSGSAVETGAPVATALNGTAAQSGAVHHLHAHDSVVIPPRRWHRMANTHQSTLVLVYATLLTL